MSVVATRYELFQKLGILKPIVDPILNAISDVEEEQVWHKNLFSSPHGQPWHTSFHASSFPGDNPKACQRKALYSLMDIPSVKPVDRAGRAVMEIGKAIEEQIVWRFHRAGILLTPPPQEIQLGFSDSRIWFTGSPDAVIRLPSNKPHPIEIKSKDHSVIEEMKRGERSYDENHRTQLLPYIAGVVGAQQTKELWTDLEICTEGTILYVSRNRPNVTHEFRFRHDEEFMEAGYKQLAEWRKNFENGILPAREKSWKWTEQPCKWCPVKPLCKLDYKEQITELENSNTIEHAKKVREKYDYEKTRNAVLDRWKDE